jgi:hypothetical protein
MVAILLFSRTRKDELPSSLDKVEAFNIATPDACF